MLWESTGRFTTVRPLLVTRTGFFSSSAARLAELTTRDPSAALVRTFTENRRVTVPPPAATTTLGVTS